MKLLLDEQLSKQIALLLRDRGHDAVAVKEREEWIGLSDTEVFELAREEGRALVTNNVRDLRPLATAAVVRGGNHAGVIFLSGDYRRTRADISRIADALETALKEHPRDDGLAEQEAWI